VVYHCIIPMASPVSSTPPTTASPTPAPPRQQREKKPREPREPAKPRDPAKEGEKKQKQPRDPARDRKPKDPAKEGEKGEKRPRDPKESGKREKKPRAPRDPTKEGEKREKKPRTPKDPSKEGEKKDRKSKTPKTPKAPKAPSTSPKSRAQRIKRSVQTFGRKKTALAVALLRPGEGRIRVNGRPLELIEPELLRYKVFEPILILGKSKFDKFDIRVRVRGGGFSSRVYAIRQALARSIVAYYHKFVDEAARREIKETLVSYDRSLLVVDTRRAEAKKPGGPGARSRYQKSYR